MSGADEEVDEPQLPYIPETYYTDQSCWDRGDHDPKMHGCVGPTMQQARKSRSINHTAKGDRHAHKTRR